MNIQFISCLAELLEESAIQNQQEYLPNLDTCIFSVDRLSTGIVTYPQEFACYS